MTLIECLTKTESELFTKFMLLAQERNFQTNVSSNKYLFIKGNSNICLVAHTDTDLEIIPDQIKIEKNLIVGYHEGQRCAIGGDDRVGVYLLYQILICHECNVPNMLLVSGEETDDDGCIDFINTFTELPNVDVFIDLDAHGCNLYTWYGEERTPAMDWIETFGFVDSEVGYRSTVYLLENFYDIPAINLSVGYYHNHTPDEFIDLDAVALTKNKLKTIINAGYIQWKGVGNFVENY